MHTWVFSWLAAYCCQAFFPPHFYCMFLSLYNVQVIKTKINNNDNNTNTAITTYMFFLLWLGCTLQNCIRSYA